MGPRLRLAATLACLAALPLRAETGPEDVRSALAPYIGQTLTEALAITPDTTGMTVAIKGPVEVPLFGDAATLTMQPYSLHLAPNPDGTWAVTSDASPAVMISSRTLEWAYRQKSGHFAGTFDPALVAFTTAQATGEGIERGVKPADPARGSILTTMARTVTATEARPGRAPGVIDLEHRSTDTYTTQTQQQEFGSIVAAAGSTDTHSSIKGLRQDALMALWRYFIAHPAPKDWASEDADLRRLAHAALPLFDHMEVEGVATKVAITAFGDSGSADSGQNRLSLDGLSPRASVMASVTLDGMKLPGFLAPDWAEPLAPTTVEVEGGALDLPLSYLADAAIDAFRPGPTRMFDRALGQRFTEIFWSDSRSFRISTVRIDGPHYAITGSGRLFFNDRGWPIYSAKVTAHGLYDLSMRLKARHDPDAEAVARIIDQALQLASVTAEGETVWDISGMSFKHVTVNGHLLP